MNRFFTLAAFLAISTAVPAQNGTAPASCSSVEASQFDFWIGEWELTWNDSLHAANIITKELEGCAIHEQFSDPARGFFGQSLSVYNPRTKQWEQTWVDSEGSYMTFTGEFDGNQMILSRKTLNRSGVKVIQSMVFSDITKDAFVWTWRASADEGKTWTTNWLIHYRRKIHR